MISRLWRFPDVHQNGRVEFAVPPAFFLQEPDSSGLGFGTVEEVALLGNYPWVRAGKVSHAAAEQIFEELELSSFKKRSFNALSGGERQRVMLARALVQNTPILCLDEPGSSLDVGFQHTLCRILKKLSREGKCVIMVSHDLFSAPTYLDRMIILDKGKLVMEGNPDHVKNSPGLRRIFNLPEVF